MSIEKLLNGLEQDTKIIIPPVEEEILYAIISGREDRNRITGAMGKQVAKFPEYVRDLQQHGLIEIHQSPKRSNSKIYLPTSLAKNNYEQVSSARYTTEQDQSPPRKARRHTSKRMFEESKEDIKTRALELIREGIDEEKNISIELGINRKRTREIADELSSEGVYIRKRRPMTYVIRLKEKTVEQIPNTEIIDFQPIPTDMKPQSLQTQEVVPALIVMEDISTMEKLTPESLRIPEQCSNFSSLPYEVYSKMFDKCIVSERAELNGAITKLFSNGVIDSIHNNSDLTRIQDYYKVYNRISIDVATREGNTAENRLKAKMKKFKEQRR